MARAGAQLLRGSGEISPGQLFFEISRAHTVFLRFASRGADKPPGEISPGQFIFEIPRAHTVFLRIASRGAYAQNL